MPSGADHCARPCLTRRCMPRSNDQLGSCACMHQRGKANAGCMVMQQGDAFQVACLSAMVLQGDLPVAAPLLLTIPYDPMVNQLDPSAQTPMPLPANLANSCSPRTCHTDGAH
eukprot:1145957-Pelagomonas_calceolata.AAC.3